MPSPEVVGAADVVTRIVLFHVDGFRHLQPVLIRKTVLILHEIELSAPPLVDIGEFRRRANEQQNDERSQRIQVLLGNARQSEIGRRVAIDGARGLSDAG